MACSGVTASRGEKTGAREATGAGDERGEKGANVRDARDGWK